MPATSAAWGGATLTVTVSGTDVSCNVLSCNVDRSKATLWEAPNTGTAQVVLDLGPDGEPSTRGPVGAIVQVKMGYGSLSRFLFTGTVQARRLEAAAEGDVLVLDCVDAMEALGRIERRADIDDPVVGVGESVNQRIARWLDNGGFTGTRSLDSSDMTTPGTKMDGNVLGEIQKAALADGGEFFIDGAGVATFKSWNWRTSDNAMIALFSDRKQSDWVPYTTAYYNEDLDEVTNTVTGTRRAIEGETTPPVPVTSENPSSITTYGERGGVGDAFDSLELVTDTQVATRVTRQVSIGAFPNARFDSIVIQPAFDPGRSWPRTIPCTYGVLVAANRVWADGHQASLFGHVIGEIWTITPTDAMLELRCSGTGTWDGMSPPRLPPVVEKSPEGCWMLSPGVPCDETNFVIFKDADGNIVTTPSQPDGIYPPGSLCSTTGICDVPPGAVRVCYRDSNGVDTCTDITPPQLDAILWVDVLEPGSTIDPNLIERVEDKPVEYTPNLESTVVNVAGDADGMMSDDVGGTIAAGQSDKLAGADLSAGWTIDWWMMLEFHLPGGGWYPIINIESVAVRLTTEYQTSGPYITQMEISVVSDGVTSLSGPLAYPIVDSQWHHYVVYWSGQALVILIDGLVQ